MVLSLKERIDKAYEAACGLADREANNKRAMRHLVGVVMGVVRRGMAGYSLAEDELDQNEKARDIRYGLLQLPFLANLMSPDGPSNIALLP